MCENSSDRFPNDFVSLQRALREDDKLAERVPRMAPEICSAMKLGYITQGRNLTTIAKVVHKKDILFEFVKHLSEKVNANVLFAVGVLELVAGIGFTITGQFWFGVPLIIESVLDLREFLNASKSSTSSVSWGQWLLGKVIVGLAGIAMHSASVALRAGGLFAQYVGGTRAVAQLLTHIGVNNYRCNLPLTSEGPRIER